MGKRSRRLDAIEGKLAAKASAGASEGCQRRMMRFAVSRRIVPGSLLGGEGEERTLLGAILPAVSFFVTGSH